MSTSASPPHKAMVLAAGLGKRMRPITERIPKPLVEVDGRPLIDHALDRLVEGGITDVVINLHYLGDQIERHLSKRKDLAITFSWEKDELLDTGGGVKKALKLFGEDPFWIVNSDSLWLNGPTPMMVRAHELWDPDKMDIQMMLHSTVEAYGYSGKGDFDADPNGLLSRRDELEVSPWLFTGLQIVHPRIFRDAPDGVFSMNLLYDKAIEADRLFGFVHDGEWFHVGSPDGLNEVEDFMKFRYAGNKRR